MTVCPPADRFNRIIWLKMVVGEIGWIIGRDFGWSQRRHAADQVGGALGDHQHRGVDVAADQVGHHGGVDDAQALGAMHPQLGVDDGPVIGRQAHPAGAGRMVDGDRGGADMGVDLGIRRLAGAGGGSPGR